MVALPDRQPGPAPTTDPAATREPAGPEHPDHDTTLVLSTCPDDTVARALAHTLVGERLAACVNQLPLTASTYRWQGKVVEESEVLLLIKTVRARYQALGDRLRDLHPYDVPEIIALRIETGQPDYLHWLMAQTSDD